MGIVDLDIRVRNPKAYVLRESSYLDVGCPVALVYIACVTDQSIGEVTIREVRGLAQQQDLTAVKEERDMLLKEVETLRDELEKAQLSLSK